MKNIVILENKLDWLKKFLQWIPEDHINNYNFVIDDRKNKEMFDVIENILDNQNKIKFRINKVSNILDFYFHHFYFSNESEDFALNCSYPIKLFVMCRYAHFSDVLYLDDDCLIIRDINEIFDNYKNSAIKISAGFSGCHIKDDDFIKCISDSVEYDIDLETFNSHTINGGIIALSCNPILVKYVYNYFSNDYIINRWKNKKLAMIDEKLIAAILIKSEANYFKTEHARLLSISEKYKSNLYKVPCIIHSYKKNSINFIDNFFYDKDKNRINYIGK